MHVCTDERLCLFHDASSYLATVDASLLDKTHIGVTFPQGLVIKCHHDICMVLEGLMQHG